LQERFPKGNISVWQAPDELDLKRDEFWAKEVAKTYQQWQ